MWKVGHLAAGIASLFCAYSALEKESYYIAGFFVLAWVVNGVFYVMED